MIDKPGPSIVAPGLNDVNNILEKEKRPPKGGLFNWINR
jgi:hypothetical protein